MLQAFKKIIPCFFLVFFSFCLDFQFLEGKQDFDKFHQHQTSPENITRYVLIPQHLVETRELSLRRSAHQIKMLIINNNISRTNTSYVIKAPSINANLSIFDNTPGQDFKRSRLQFSCKRQTCKTPSLKQLLFIVTYFPSSLKHCDHLFLAYMSEYLRMLTLTLTLERPY